MTPSTSKSTAKENTKTPAAKKKQNAGGGGGNKDVEEAGPMCGDIKVDTADEGSDGEGGKARKKRTKQTQPEIPIVQPTPAKC